MRYDEQPDYADIFTSPQPQPQPPPLPPPPQKTALPAVELPAGQGGTFVPGAGGSGGTYSFFTAPEAKAGTSLPGATFMSPQPSAQPIPAAAPEPGALPPRPQVSAIPARPNFDMQAESMLRQKYGNRMMYERGNPTSPEARKIAADRTMFKSQLESQYRRQRDMDDPLRIAEIQAGGKLGAAEAAGASRLSVAEQNNQTKRDIAMLGIAAATAKAAQAHGFKLEEIDATSKAGIERDFEQGRVNTGLLKMRIEGDLARTGLQGEAALAVAEQNSKARMAEAEQRGDMAGQIAEYKTQAYLAIKKQEHSQLLAKEGEVVPSPELPPRPKPQASQQPIGRPGTSPDNKLKITQAVYDDAMLKRQYKTYAAFKEAYPTANVTKAQFERAVRIGNRAEQELDNELKYVDVSGVKRST